MDKYLEHGRAVIFHNNGEEKIYILSADWMTRNLDSRIEAGVPIFDPGIQQTVRDIFHIQWNDTVKARDLAWQEENRYRTLPGTKPRRSQLIIYEYYKK